MESEALDTAREIQRTTRALLVEFLHRTPTDVGAVSNSQENAAVGQIPPPAASIIRLFADYVEGDREKALFVFYCVLFSLLFPGSLNSMERLRLVPLVALPLLVLPRVLSLNDTITLVDVMGEHRQLYIEMWKNPQVFQKEMRNIFAGNEQVLKLITSGQYRIQDSENSIYQPGKSRIRSGATLYMAALLYRSAILQINCPWCSAQVPRASSWNFQTTFDCFQCGRKFSTSSASNSTIPNDATIMMDDVDDYSSVYSFKSGAYLDDSKLESTLAVNPRNDTMSTVEGLGPPHMPDGPTSFKFLHLMLTAGDITHLLPTQSAYFATDRSTTPWFHSLDPDSAPNALHIHPLLDALAFNPNLYFNLEQGHFLPMRLHSNPRQPARLSQSELREPAFYPPLTSLSMIHPRTPSWPIQLELPGELKLAPHPQPISVIDILVSIHRAMHVQITHSDWALLNSEEEAAVSTAFHRRCREEAARRGSPRLLEKREMEERGYGVKRVDYLRGQAAFRGLVWQQLAGELEVRCVQIVTA
ncbi:hypothetical protein R3P38DRAFT_3042916 [Favolaschia claudopus]|uniref:Uncharacterized protein n=1 Tax=Favolaschia claudopus TaxID=2862362 RepID=A0AAW0A837_9AGAR